LNYTRNL